MNKYDDFLQRFIYAYEYPNLTDGQKCEVLQKFSSELKALCKAPSNKPSLDECRFYFCSLNAGALADGFFDHFQSNGWLVGGKARMRDWQAAARNWARNSPLFQLKAKNTPQAEADRGAEIIERQAMKEKLLKAAQMECFSSEREERAAFFEKRDEFLGNYKAIFKAWREKLQDDRIAPTLNWEKIHQEHKAIMAALFASPQAKPALTDGNRRNNDIL